LFIKATTICQPMVCQQHFNLICCHKGDFDQYFFMINNFIKHVNAKWYNRHVVTGAMKPSEFLSVGQVRALGLLLFGELSGTMGPACDIYEVRWECHPKQHCPSQDQVHESWTEEDAKENWGNGVIQSASQGGASGLTVELRTGVWDSIQKDNATTSRQGMKQKEKNNPVGSCGCCTWAQWCEWQTGYQWTELTNWFHIWK
jgi:hypothetical protein